MATEHMLFVNLPVTDLQRSMRYFGDLGFSFEEKFTDESAACMVLSGKAFVMLLSSEKFEGFCAKPVGDPHDATVVLIAISADSREGVDELVDGALAAGGSPHRDADDYGFMYSRSFCDPDGHVWEVVWMDPAAVAEGPANMAGNPVG